MKFRQFISLFFLCGAFCLYLSCHTDKLVVEESKQFGHLEKLTITTATLSENNSDEPVQKTIYVFLPPKYETSGERYPVIYYLHGHGVDSTEMLTFEDELFNDMEQGKADPFILVAVNGDNRFGNSFAGTFYVNAKNGCMWEDYFIQELVPLIDERYRTLASAQSRGLMGFSMGGFGALRLGLAYPEFFSTIWALCPGVFVPEKGLEDAMATWNRFGGNFLESYAAAFSTGAKIPLLDGSAEDDAIAEEWEAGFGGWEQRINSYLEQEHRLLAVRIVYGENDRNHPWIIEGSKYLADLMLVNGLQVELIGYPIGHNIQPETVRDDALPFFQCNLVAE